MERPWNCILSEKRIKSFLPPWYYCINVIWNLNVYIYLEDKNDKYSIFLLYVFYITLLLRFILVILSFEYYMNTWSFINSFIHSKSKLYKYRMMDWNFLIKRFITFIKYTIHKETLNVMKYSYIVIIITNTITVSLLRKFTARSYVCLKSDLRLKIFVKKWIHIIKLILVLLRCEDTLRNYKLLGEYWIS